MKRNNLKLSKREFQLLQTLIYGCMYLSSYFDWRHYENKSEALIETKLDSFSEYTKLQYELFIDDFSPNSIELLSIIMDDFNLPFLKRQIEIKDIYLRNEFLKP